MTRDHVYMTRDHVYMTHDHVYMTHDHVYMTHDHVYMTHDHVYMTRDHVYVIAPSSGVPESRAQRECMDCGGASRRFDSRAGGQKCPGSGTRERKRRLAPPQS